MTPPDETTQPLPPHEQRLLAEHAHGDVALFESLAARRAAREPLQYLTGTAYFRTVEVAVGPGVFIPRPETEVMTGWAIDWLRGRDYPVVVELCAGSGAISLAVATELGGCDQHAVERDAAAAAYLRRNVAGAGVAVVESDMADALPELDGRVDLVIANPPYIPDGDAPALPSDVRDHEPPASLFSGSQGLDAIRVVADVAARLLRPGGVVACEHGDDQGALAPSVFEARGFADVADHADLTRRPRFVTARRR